MTEANSAAKTAIRKRLVELSPRGNVLWTLFLLSGVIRIRKAKGAIELITTFLNSIGDLLLCLVVFMYFTVDLHNFQSGTQFCTSCQTEICTCDLDDDCSENWSLSNSIHSEFITCCHTNRTPGKYSHCLLVEETERHKIMVVYHAIIIRTLLFPSRVQIDPNNHTSYSIIPFPIIPLSRLCELRC
jgi:hypothetical protein